MINKKTQRELLEIVDFGVASTFLSGLPINQERVEKYKDLIRSGATAENLFKAMADDREKILQRIKPAEKAID